MTVYVDKEQLRMGAEVTRLFGECIKRLGCKTCGIGLAIDTVGRKYGNVPFDWAGKEAKKCGHRCSNTNWTDEPKPAPPVEDNDNEW